MARKELTIEDHFRLTRANRAYYIKKKKSNYKEIKELIGTYVTQGLGECSIYGDKPEYTAIKRLHKEGYQLKVDPTTKGKIIIKWE